MAKTVQKNAAKKKQDTKKKAAPMRSRPRGRPGESGGAVVPILLLIIGMVAMFRWEVAVLFFFYLVPTFVLALTFRGAFAQEKVMTVTLMNLAGIIPFAVQVWHAPRNLMYVMTDVINAVVMLGAAGFGYLLLWLGPHGAAVIIQMMRQDRLKAIGDERKALSEEWGNEVLDITSDTATSKAGQQSSQSPNS